MVIAIISILFVFFSVMFRFLCAASGEIKMFKDVHKAISIKAKA